MEPQTEREPEALEQDLNIPAREQGSGKNKRGWNSSSTLSIWYNYIWYVRGSTTRMPFLNEKIYRYERTHFYHCTLLLTLWQHFYPEQKEISHIVKRGKNCTVSVQFSSLLSFFQPIPLHRRCNLKTLGCLQSIFKNSWPWNTFTFHSTRDNNHCVRRYFRENLLLREPAGREHVKMRLRSNMSVYTRVHTH